MKKTSDFSPERYRNILPNYWTILEHVFSLTNIPYSVQSYPVSARPKSHTDKNENKRERKTGKNQVLFIADKTMPYEVTNRISLF
jgi:hypothetical protein